MSPRRELLIWLMFQDITFKEESVVGMSVGWDLGLFMVVAIKRNLIVMYAEKSIPQSRT